MTIAAAELEMDRSLVHSVATGDGDALEALMTRHEPWLRGVAFSVLGRSDDVDDVLQQVWMAVWRGRDGLPNVRNCRNWLYTLTRNVAIDARRKCRRRKDLWRQISGLFRPGTAGGAEQELIARDGRRSVREAVQCLDEKYRTVLVMRVWGELSYRQIADTLDVPVDTVETRLVRARRKLREKLSRGEHQ